MSKQSALNIKKLPASLACLGLTFLLLLGLWGSGFLSYSDTALYDFLLGLKARYNPRPLNPQIIPVDLNDRSEMNLGARLNDRSAFGDIFSVMAHSGAQAALDFIFQGERDKDQAMLNAAARLKGIFVGLVAVPEGRENISYRELTGEEKNLLRKHLWKPKQYGEGSVPRAGTFIMPFMGLGEYATQLAHLSVEPDSDGIYRRTPLFYAWEDGLVPAISLAAALWELGINGNDIEVHYGKNVIIPLGPDENISIPIDSSGVVVVPFGGKWEHTVNRFSMDKLANAWYDEKELGEVRNDILRTLCFVADTTFAKKDIGPVPLESYYPLSGLHTWVISSILDSSIGNNTFYRQNPSWYSIVCVAFIAALFIFLGTVKKDWIFNTVSACLFLLFSGLTLCLWFFARIIPWYSLGAIEIIFAWLLGFLYRFSAQRKMQTNLERYVPRSVAQQLISGGGTHLVPSYKELTILFSDICGFTKWSSDKEARDVHAFLNEYLESMAAILFDYGATVDKFMGDGILAFFGDPLAIPNHPGVAINAALEMQKKIKALGEKWQPLAGINLKVRIGINTGRVIVGDLGTKRRIEYTVIGSTVNLAQRMESLATPGGILVTEDSYTALKNIPHSYSFNRIEVAVKGYDKPIIAYEVIV